MQYHEPVLLDASVELLDIQECGVYVDATFGGGGHSRKILEALGPKGKLLGFDQDAEARQNIPDDKRFVFVHGNFRHLKNFLRLKGLTKVDGILADLGVSSHQFDKAKRGFSYRFESKLDMRMNPESELTAAEVLNSYDAVRLQKLFSEFGEVRNARTLAEAIVRHRAVKPFGMTQAFVAFLEPLARGNKMRYMSQVFQALRIEVNNEMEVLDLFLNEAEAVLNEGARLVIISYHSLEDRMVKNFFKTGNTAGEVKKDFYGNIFRPFKVLTKKPIEATAAEIKRNSRARSAKLRAAEKIKLK